MRQFAVVLLLLALMVPIPKSTGMVAPNKTTPYPITPSDLNGNGIDDILDHTIQDTVGVIVHYDGSLPSFLKNYAITYVFTQFNAVKIDVSKTQLQSIIDHKDITYLESDLRVKPYLLESTAQMGLPTSFWQDGISGSSQMSIAVLDSGIDFSHPMFKNRIPVSYNAIDNNATAAIDNVGHGTHVAGIAAGAMEVSNDTYRESTVGTLAKDCDTSGCYIDLAFQLPNISEGESVRIVYDWGAKGVNSGSTAGFYVIDPTTVQLACADCQGENSNGYIDQTVTLSAGSYIVGFYSYSGAAGLSYEAGVEYKKPGLSGSGPDIKGVAYTTNIIPVKVLDNSDGGTLEVFDRAVQWVINHREQYNITVVNLSLGLDVYSSSLDLLMRNLVDVGILPVVAAGNGGANSNGIFSPASAPEALTVGAINNLGEVTYYSNVGSSEVNKIAPKPDVMAPGGSSANTLVGYKTAYRPGLGTIASAAANIGTNVFKDDLIGYQGTSMSAPHIAGLASLIASQIQANGGWDWNSRSDVMQIKRMIEAGTYEVGNIGFGREQVPNTPTNQQIVPTIDRVKRDNQEGWGAVDASAVYGLLSKKIDVGYTSDVSFDLTNPTARKTHGWYMNLEPGTVYGFSLEVPPKYDMDLKVINAETGPLLNGKDYGELQIMASSTHDVGQNEGIALSVQQATKVYIVATIVDGPANGIGKFSVTKLDKLPEITINTPTQGQEITNPVTIEFSSTSGPVTYELDGTYRGSITSGDQVQMGLGDHVLNVTLQDPSGIKVTSSVSFTVVEQKSFLDFPSSFIIPIAIIALIILRVKKSDKFKL